MLVNLKRLYGEVGVDWAFRGRFLEQGKTKQEQPVIHVFKWEGNGVDVGNGSHFRHSEG